MAKKTGDKKIHKGSENLKPFKPGKDDRRNTKGRPVGTENSATRLKRILELTSEMLNPVNGVKEKFTVLEQMDLALIAKARKGDVKAYEQILDRFEGKSVQKNINVNKVGIDAQKEDYVD